MTRKRWIGAVLLAATTAVALPPRAAPGQIISPSESVQRDLEQLQAKLIGDASSAGEREEAARRLVSRQSEGAREILRAALVSAGNRPAQLAVARALATDPRPDDRFVVPLFALLGPDRNLSDAAAQALANFKGNGEVLTRLSNFALARQPREPVRIATIKAIGSLVEKRAAETLITIVVRPDEPPAIRDAAADALVSITGLTENGRDLQRWQLWWRDNANKSETQWKLDLLNARSTRFDQLQLRQAQLSSEIQNILATQYQLTPEAQKPDVLLRYLKSSEPAVRATGGRIVWQDAINNRPVPVAAKEYLRELVGDSAPEVRLEVARALRMINDKGALEALLTQLSQEPESDVRAAIASALGPIGDLRAMPDLLTLLHDPSNLVVEAAATAIHDLAPLARDQQPQLLGGIVRGLRDVLERRATGQAGRELREAVVEAMVPLRDPRLFETFARLLNPREEPPGVRRAALRGLGELADPNAADTIARALEDDVDPAVRLEAVRALGKTAGFQHAETLYKRMDPAEDEKVRAESWIVLASLFPSAPKDQLDRWADRFAQEPERRLTVLKVLAEQHMKDKDEDRLAYTRQNIGETLMRLGRPGEAALYFSPALDHWLAKEQSGMVTEGLIQQLIIALLQGRKYTDAAKFAADMITRDPAYQQTMGVAMRTEAERLRDGKDYESAMELINEALAMTPPLDARFQGDLRYIQDQVRRILEETRPPTGPQGTAAPSAARPRTGAQG